MGDEVRVISESTTRFFPDYMAFQQALPLNTSADANNQTLPLGRAQNRIDVVLLVYTDISIADGQTFSVKLQTSSDNGVDDAWVDLVIIFTVTASGSAYTALAGNELARYAISTDKELYFKAVITTDDVAAVGAVNIIPDRIA